MIRAIAFAARSLVRQPGRSAVGILGIAAVGALLFDMLLLSRGLVVSFSDLLDSVGFDVRVLSTDGAPFGGPRLSDATSMSRQLAALPEVEEVVPIRMMEAESVPRPAENRGPAGADAQPKEPVGFSLMGIDAGARRPWTVRSGRDPADAGVDAGRPAPLLVNAALAEALHASTGDEVAVRLTCASNRAALAPSPFRISGIAEFPFDAPSQLSAVASRASVSAACGSGAAPGEDLADLLLIASRQGYGSDLAVAAIRRARPDLHAATNEEIVARMQQQGFTYFRQISAVLSAITMLFGFLLITVLLTVSVNQRLGEIAAIRALGFSRARVAADVLWQSALLVGTGGVLALPLGFALSLWLDRILKGMPSIPAALHFFVFEPRALVVQAVLLVLTALLAAVYPMLLVARLPIAATLRNEVVG